MHVERQAGILLLVGSLVMSITCGAIIVSGFFAGVLEDHAERVFWAGALTAGLMVAVLAAAAFPGGEDDRRTIRRVTWLTRLGIVLFVAAPTLCIVAMIADFYRLLV